MVGGGYRRPLGVHLQGGYVLPPVCELEVSDMKLVQVLLAIVVWFGAVWLAASYFDWWLLPPVTVILVVAVAGAFATIRWILDKDK